VFALKALETFSFGLHNSLLLPQARPHLANIAVVGGPLYELPVFAMSALDFPLELCVSLAQLLKFQRHRAQLLATRTPTVGCSRLSRAPGMPSRSHFSRLVYLHIAKDPLQHGYFLLRGCKRKPQLTLRVARVRRGCPLFRNSPLTFVPHGKCIQECRFRLLRR